MGIFTRTINTDDDGVISPATYNAPRPLTASAARINLQDKREIDAIAQRRMTDKWQEEAWDYYDMIGELKFAATIISNALSRINIYAAYVTDSSSIPARIDVVEHLEDDYKKSANASLYLLESGMGGSSGLLRAAGMNLFIVGECYLVREPPKFSSGEPERYQIRSIDEIVKTKQGKENTLAIKPRRDSKTQDYISLPSNGYIARLWRSHPRYADEADSSVRGVLDLCDELLLLSRTTSNTAKSRLGAGLLFVPDGLSNAYEVEGEMTEEGVQNVNQDGGDNFEEELIDAMTTPISDPTSASAVVPLVLRGSPELGKAITFIKFERSFDTELTKRAETVLERVMSGLDIPKDMVGGFSSLKGSSAKLVEESMYTSHIEPLILMVCDCLTSAFLRPALRAMGYPEHEIARTVIWYDPSAITTKPSKSESATIGYKDNVISADAWRRAHGFSKSDAPTQLEIAQKLAVAKGLISEPLAEKLIATLIPDLMEGLRAEQMQQSDPGSAQALNDALSGDPATGAPANDTIGQTPNQAPAPAGPPAPSTLLEP